jgi:NADH-quinone oxidoreductase subunit M
MIALLTVIISFLGAAIIGFIPSRSTNLIRSFALVIAVSTFAASAVCYWQYLSAEGEIFQQVISLPWIPVIGAQFKIGVDGLSISLLMLTGIIAVCGVLFSWEQDERANQFYAYYFALVGGVFGVFLSLDLFLLLVFYEIAIVPKYFIIAIWGSGKKAYAAMKLVLFSFVGSAVALLGLIALYFGSGLQTFDLVQLMAEGEFSAQFQMVVFPILFVGFGILAGMWPFHTWAPTGHVAAPTAASMLLAGVVMKLGAYGCLRVAIGLLPEGAIYWAPVVGWIAVINIVYGALIALVQKDFKYVIGYSSVSHMGFVLLGLATLNEVGLMGASLQMFSHGIIGALLFAIVGTVIYSRTHTRQLHQLHNLMQRMPGICWVFIAAGLASMGLPGFSGFVSELHVLIGTWNQEQFSIWIIILAGFGILATFTYTLVKIHEAFFREAPAHNPNKVFSPMTMAEKAGCGILLFFALAIGIYPNLLTTILEPSLAPILEALASAAK